TAAQLAKASETATAAEHRAQAIVARARAEASALVADIRHALATELDKLKRAERSRRSLEESRRRVRDASSRIETVAPHGPGEMPATLAPGATVAAEHLGVRGELIAIAGGSATVRSGSVTVRVPLQALRPAGGTGRARGGAGSGRRGGAGPRTRPPTPAGPFARAVLLLGATAGGARGVVERAL